MIHLKVVNLRLAREPAGAPLEASPPHRALEHRIRAVADGTPTITASESARCPEF